MQEPDICLHEFFIDIYRSELVFDHSDTLPVLLCEDIVDQCRLARTEESGNYRDGQLFLVGNGFWVARYRQIARPDREVIVDRRKYEAAIIELDLLWHHPAVP